jgi:hypothetical protein
MDLLKKEVGERRAREKRAGRNGSRLRIGPGHGFSSIATQLAHVRLTRTAKSQQFLR